MLDTFAVIAEPRRRQILEILRSRNATVNELVEALAISQPAVSKHLRILRDSGLVKVQPVGQQRIYRLDPQPLKEVGDWVDAYREYWRDALGRLDTHLASTRTSDSPITTRTKPARQTKPARRTKQSKDRSKK